MKTKTFIALNLLFAAILFADICSNPPELSVPFEYDPNLVTHPIVDVWEPTAGETYAWILPACDDENDVYAFVFTALPANVTIEPNDYLNWNKYVDANEQQEYVLYWTPTEIQEGVHYIGYAVLDKRADPNNLDRRTIVVKVSLPPNNPPVILKPVPFAAAN